MHPDYDEPEKCCSKICKDASPRTECESAFNELNDSIESLHESVNTLSLRLEPVLREYSPLEEGECANGKGTSGITRQIYNKATALSRLQEVVDDIIGRLSI